MISTSSLLEHPRVVTAWSRRFPVKLRVATTDAAKRCGNDGEASVRHRSCAGVRGAVVLSDEPGLPYRLGSWRGGSARKGERARRVTRMKGDRGRRLQARASTIATLSMRCATPSACSRSRFNNLTERRCPSSPAHRRCRPRRRGQPDRQNWPTPSPRPASTPGRRIATMLGTSRQAARERYGERAVRP